MITIIIIKNQFNFFIQHISHNFKAYFRKVKENNKTKKDDEKMFIK